VEPGRDGVGAGRGHALAGKTRAWILASAPHGTLYIGVTSNIVQRVYQHKEGLADGFTRQHGVKDLVWFEGTPSIEAAIGREKQIKNWKREWKLALIQKMNPLWRDLYPDIL
jgi:putative endonuclease